MKTDVLIVGTGCAGLYCALNLPSTKNITIITKSDAESNDSFLAQGGICMLRDESDYQSFFDDTLKAGHYENNKNSVSIMINSSADVINDLISIGVDFNRDSDGNLMFTREGAHSNKRILFHKDITGKEITSKLLNKVKTLKNVTIYEHTTLVDIMQKDNTCYGGIVRDKNGKLFTISADFTVMATGGIGGLYRHSTNFKHLTGDAIAIAIKHNIKLKDIQYVQIHPTTLYTKDSAERSFLISESVRGEGAHLYNKNNERFVNELLPRDLLTKEIHHQMKKDDTEFVWEDLRSIPADEVKRHFPNIVEHCKEQGYDVFTESIPVVPAQHYFMGGIHIDTEGKTSMSQLYAVGETACNGVHGKNRLASNSLLEALVFAKRAAKNITASTALPAVDFSNIDLTPYADAKALEKEYADSVKLEIRRATNLTK